MIRKYFPTTVTYNKTLVVQRKKVKLQPCCKLKIKRKLSRVEAILSSVVKDVDEIRSTV